MTNFIPQKRRVTVRNKRLCIIYHRHKSGHTYWFTFIVFELSFKNIQSWTAFLLSKIQSGFIGSRSRGRKRGGPIERSCNCLRSWLLTTVFTDALVSSWDRSSCGSPANICGSPGPTFRTYALPRSSPPGLASSQTWKPASGMVQCEKVLLIFSPIGIKKEKAAPFSQQHQIMQIIKDLQRGINV